MSYAECSHWFEVNGYHRLPLVSGREGWCDSHLLRLPGYLAKLTPELFLASICRSIQSRRPALDTDNSLQTGG
jgi:hypothetical protein